MDKGASNIPATGENGLINRPLETPELREAVIMIADTLNIDGRMAARVMRKLYKLGYTRHPSQDKRTGGRLIEKPHYEIQSKEEAIQIGENMAKKVSKKLKLDLSLPEQTPDMGKIAKSNAVGMGLIPPEIDKAVKAERYRLLMTLGAYVNDMGFVEISNHVPYQSSAPEIKE